MSESNTTKIVERVARLFDSKRELVRWFLANASAKHGTPYVPEDVVVEERTIDVKKTTSEQSEKTIEKEYAVASDANDGKNNNGIGSKAKAAAKKYVLPAAIAGSLGAGGMAIFNNFTGGNKEQIFDAPSAEEFVEPQLEPKTQPRDGSLFQYLEDGGFHRPK